MKNRPPLPIVAVAIAYFFYLVWQMVTEFMPVTAGRFAVSVALFFFVFRGSRAAGNTLAFLCAVSAVMLLVSTVASIKENVKEAIALTVFAVSLLAFAAYVFFSPKVRAFQRNAVVLQKS
ncbi:hypothetical protein [Pseudomonas mucidolens]|uniref:Uncharacterized protein n=1 Tax=Pseudomonas mucidolens TaxID=46679 RepID=A0A1H2ME89_9PSED|nr:hypothetical protein [Pseudomonas mucidolens]SDU91394.1 hypothetical protein SAMN05216202_1529 [Pseudomonas mucidolens]SQH34054.1 Uncharacterised protein [Pseudomonas mucidolens]